MEFTYRDRAPAGDLSYTVTVRTEPAGDSAQLHLDLAATRTDGSPAMEGTISLTASALPATMQVLNQVFTTLRPLVCRAGQPVTAKPGGAPAANAGAPWTAELRQTWLAEHPTTPARHLIARLASTMGRTRYAIRSQLARVNCDPDVPGRELSSGTPAPDQAGDH